MLILLLYCVNKKRKLLLNMWCIVVVAGSQAVPEALQKCHSLSRDLQKNQTLLFGNFAMLSHQLQNFSSQVCHKCSITWVKNLLIFFTTMYYCIKNLITLVVSYDLAPANNNGLCLVKVFAIVQTTKDMLYYVKHRALLFILWIL